ncbi:MAG: hypothetical protein HUK01_04785 [Bacteroidaceae bacterium]|nr:hypothetical protein [Bacteroidaceae bacterium]
MIFRLTSKVAFLVVLVALTACHNSFHTAYYDDGRSIVDPYKDKNTKENVNKLSNVRTTVVGLDKGWDKGDYSLCGKRFNMWGLRLANYENDATPNWASDADRMPECFNAEFRFDAEGTVKFTDGKKHRYNNAQPLWRYGFYISYPCAGATGEPFVEDGVLKQNITVDGLTDCAVGVSYLTEKFVQQTINGLSKESVYEAGNKLFNMYREGVLYTNMSALRGIQPEIYMKHLFARMSVNVRGVASQKQPKDPLYRNVVITDIQISTPSGGKLTIANPNWVNSEAFMADVNGGKVFVPTNTALKAVKQIRQTGLTTAQAKDRNFYVEQLKDYGYDTSASTDWWQVNSKTYTQVAKDIVLPLSATYEVRVNYYYVNRVVDKNHQLTDELVPGEEIFAMTGSGSAAAIYTVSGSAVTAGGSHEIDIDVAAYEDMKITIK